MGDASSPPPQGSMISACLEQLCEGASWRLQQWACIGLGRLWRGWDAARWAGVRDLAHEKLGALLPHPRPEVRAACAFALATFMAAGAGPARTDHANALDQQVAVQLAARLRVDASPLARAELLAALQWTVLLFEQHFLAVCVRERGRRCEPGRGRAPVDAGQDALEPARGRAPVDTGQDALQPGREPARPLPLPTIGPSSPTLFAAIHSFIHSRKIHITNLSKNKCRHLLSTR